MFLCFVSFYVDQTAAVMNWNTKLTTYVSVNQRQSNALADCENTRQSTVYRFQVRFVPFSYLLLYQFLYSAFINYANVFVGTLTY